MTLVKFQTAPSPYKSLFSEFLNTAMDNSLPAAFATNRFPALNVVETSNGFRLDLAVPGFDKSDFSLALDKNVLTVSAKKEDEHTENTEKFRRREFAFHAFERSFNLPDSVDHDQVKANYQNGVLGIELVKKTPAANPVKTIEIG